MVTKNRRRKYYIKTAVQLKYIKTILIAMIIPILVLGACLYYLIFYILSQEIDILKSIFYPPLSGVIFRVNIFLFISLPIIFLGLISWAIFISHRLAGPIYRLGKELDDITANKDFSRRIYFRKYDEIQEVADKVNKLLDIFESK